MAFDARRTQVAQSAFDFSNYFAQSFAAVRVLGPVVRRPDLTAPEGMSTEGGKLARQPVVLQPVDRNMGGAAITVGFVDIPQRRAVLRTYRCLLAMHQARFRDRPFDLDPHSYESFFHQAKGLLGACGLMVTEEDDARASLSAISQRPPPQSAAQPQPQQLGTVVDRPAAGGNFWNTVAMVLMAFVLGAFAGGLAVYAKFVGF